MQSKGILKQIQPVGLTGIGKHTFAWICASPKGKVYRNPNFLQSESKEEQREIAIYCIHGTADRSSAFKKIAEGLLKNDNFPTNISTIHLVSFKKRGHGISIEDFAKQLKVKIQENQHRDIILMGHSRGGLVAAYFAENLAKNIGVNVHSVMSICTPFQGTSFSIKPLSWLSESVKEMDENSQFLSVLQEKIRQSSIEYFNFAVTDDTLVSPDAAYVKGPHSSLVLLDMHGHLSVMHSKRLMELLQNCLEHVMLKFKKIERREIDAKI